MSINNTPFENDGRHSPFKSSTLVLIPNNFNQDTISFMKVICCWLLSISFLDFFYARYISLVALRLLIATVFSALISYSWSNSWFRKSELLWNLSIKLIFLVLFLLLGILIVLLSGEETSFAVSCRLRKSTSPVVMFLRVRSLESRFSLSTSS